MLRHGRGTGETRVKINKTETDWGEVGVTGEPIMSLFSPSWGGVPQTWSTRGTGFNRRGFMTVPPVRVEDF